MPEALDILDLPGASRPPGMIVGLRGIAPIRYDEFAARVQCWRALLRRTPGQNFALYISDSIEFAAALFGAWHAGKTAYLPSDTLPATCESLSRVVHGYLGEFPSQYATIAPCAEDGFSRPEAFNRLDPEFVGLVVYTSGSTGVAQAIPKKLSQMATEVATLELSFGSALRNAEIVATVSHQHIYGLLFKVLWPLAAARVIHARSFTFPEELVAATEGRDCVLISSPAHLKRLPDSPVWAGASHRIQAVFSSGGPLSLEVAHATAQLLGYAPIEVYGSSETGGIAWRQRRPHSDESWTMLPGVAWRIASDEHVLEIRSPHLPDTNWFQTSDRAQAIDDTHFLLQRRVDRIVKIEEKRISLDTIETRLAKSPFVAAARVLVIEGKRQTIAAFVVPSSAGRKVLSEVGKFAFNSRLRDCLADAVERIALPRSWHYLDALPVNAQGKTTYAELTALLDKEQPPAQPVLPHRRLLEKDAQRAVFELVAPQELLYFDGHFPGSPILAGVVQVDWAIAFGRECFELPGVFRGIHALKFQRVIRPDRPFTLELLHDPIKSSLTFKYFSSTGQHASGRIMFGAADV